MLPSQARFMLPSQAWFILPSQARDDGLCDTYACCLRGLVCVAFAGPSLHVFFKREATVQVWQEMQKLLLRTMARPHAAERPRQQLDVGRSARQSRTTRPEIPLFQPVQLRIFQSRTNRPGIPLRPARHFRTTNLKRTTDPKPTRRSRTTIFEPHGPVLQLRTAISGPARHAWTRTRLYVHRVHRKAINLLRTSGLCHTPRWQQRPLHVGDGRLFQNRIA